MLKVDLHAHTADDPSEFIPHTAWDLIDRAAALGYQALAITLHDKQLDVEPLMSYAGDRGLLIIPGIERSIHGRHLLLINFPPEVEAVQSFEEVAQLKARSRGLVIAPHPFYPAVHGLRNLLDVHAPLVDAIEVNAMYTRQLDFNKAAVRWAKTHRKPLVGNADVHRLGQLGTTFSLIDAAPTADAVCEAIRAGRVEVRTEPLSWLTAVTTFARMLAGGMRRPNPDRVSR